MTQIAITARTMAYMRSLDVAVSSDPLARQFVTDEAKALGDTWLAVYPGLARHGALRCRYFEDIAGKYIAAGAMQMINMAAGLNTFPYRHTAARLLRHYAEFDLPDMLAYKKTASLPKPIISVEYVPTDLSKEITPSLSQLSWDWTQPTVILMEGISYYVPLESLKAVIRTLSRHLAKGSCILMDYFRPKDTETRLYKTFFDTIMPRGELLHTFFTHETVVDLLDPFKVVSDRLMPDIEADYCPDKKTIPFASYLVAESE